jgi:Helix-turn-helix domain
VSDDPITLAVTVDADQLRELEDRVLERVLKQVRAAEAERLLTVSEVAEMFRVDETWVRRHQKELGGYRLSDGGGRNPIRFRAATVERYLRKRQFKSRPARSWRDDDDWALPASEQAIG